MNRKLIKNYICLIYPLFTLIYFLYMFFSGIRTGITMTFFLLAGILGICALGYITVKTTEDKVFGAYILYNLLSGIWCVAFGIPVGVFIGEISTTLLPMMLYYAGRGFDEEYAGKYYHGFILAALLMGGIGAVLFIRAPQFYIDFSYVNEFISKADAPTMRVRMNSLVGSGPMGCFVAYSTCASAYFLRKEDKKDRMTGMVYIILSILFSFMANQRSAMFCIILFLVFLNLVDFMVDKNKPLKYLWMEAGAVAALLAGIFIFARGVFEKFRIRLASIPDGFGERSESWIAAVNNMVNFWIGDGLGSHGHRAVDHQYYIVADGGLVKLYAEMGLIGTSMIIFVVALVYIKSFQRQGITAAAGGVAAESAAPEESGTAAEIPAAAAGGAAGGASGDRKDPNSEDAAEKRKLGLVVPELAIITSAILMSIGSNVLEMELCAPIAYFALGRAVKLLSGDRAGEEYIGKFDDSKEDIGDNETDGIPEGVPAAEGSAPAEASGYAGGSTASGAEGITGNAIAGDGA